MLFLPVALVRIALFAGLVACFVAAAPAEAKQSTCQGGETLAKNRFARVYEVDTREGTTLVGCLYGHSPRELADAFDDEYTTSSSYDDVHVRGRFVDYTVTYTDVSCKADCPPDYDGTYVTQTLYDLRRHRDVGFSDLFEDALRIRSTTLGAVAWVERADTEGEHEVHTLDYRGERLRDSGVIDPASLTVRDRTVSWTGPSGQRSLRLR